MARQKICLAAAKLPQLILPHLKGHLICLIEVFLLQHLRRISAMHCGNVSCVVI